MSTNIHLGLIKVKNWFYARKKKKMSAKCWNSQKVFKSLGRVLDMPYCCEQWILRKCRNVPVWTFRPEIFLMKSSISKDQRQKREIISRTWRNAGRKEIQNQSTNTLKSLKFWGTARTERLANEHSQSSENRSLCQPGVCHISCREAEGNTNVVATLMLKEGNPHFHRRGKIRAWESAHG